MWQRQSAEEGVVEDEKGNEADVGGGGSGRGGWWRNGR